MIPLSELLKKAASAFPGRISLKYAHPNLYLLCTVEDFAGLTEDARLEKFARRLDIQPEVIAQITTSGTMQLALVTQTEKEQNYDFLDKSKNGHHWIEFMGETVSAKPVRKNVGALPTALHFYGFKGGQGRSTILALLAKQMADDGYRILAVDGDLEAPSLDILFSAKASTNSGTLMGYGSELNHARPISVYVPRDGEGVVDLIPCRPQGSVYDLDFAAFVLKSSLDVVLPEEIASQIIRVAAEQKYDVIFFDHRSGLSNAILPIIAACPGPVAICLRLDEQSSAADGFFEILLRQNIEFPGLFISFSLDPEDTMEKMRGRHAIQIDKLLLTLADALVLGSYSNAESGQLELPLAPDELTDYWIPWFHDRSLLHAQLPNPPNISKENLDSLHQIRTVIGYAKKKEHDQLVQQNPSMSGLTGSGATDEGLFIETEALRRLRATNAADTYIFGRKGTGKTRLLRELAVRQLGEPLVVAADFKYDAGIPSSDAIFKDLSDSLVTDPEKFWWAIFASALKQPEHATREQSLDSLSQISREVQLNGPASIRIADIVSLASNQSKSRVFLIDGIETAFLSSRLLSFLEGLFKFLLALQNAPKLQDKVAVRLFLRTDLARRAFQNIEQQISGRVIYLSWDTQTILNFVLSRIAALPWFARAFPKAVEQIINTEQAVISGKLSVEECDGLLSQIFPQKIRRNNLLTLTFLKTYFSDGAGETATYYPRIYDRFLQLIDDPSGLERQYANVPQMEGDRISQALIFAAHEQASKDYLQQVEAELAYLLQLSSDYDENGRRVKELLQAFAGLQTPFNVDNCVQQLFSKLGGFSETLIRTALVQMRDVGIFEERPGFPGEWRVGRLFKSSLGMKYVR